MNPFGPQPWKGSPLANPTYELVEALIKHTSAISVLDNRMQKLPPPQLLKNYPHLIEELVKHADAIGRAYTEFLKDEEYGDE